MNKKTKTAYVCSNCGQDYAKWHGKCDSCGMWDTVTEFRVGSSGKSKSWTGAAASEKSAPQLLSECLQKDTPRTKSSFTEIDRVLGGGLVRGAFILLGGDPGIGKSTILLQIASRLSERDMDVIYISGEESSEQVSLRAERLGVGKSNVKILAETRVETILTVLGEEKPDLVIVDSIQTTYSEEIESAPGSVSQIRECCAMMLRHAKTEGTVFFLIGHVTKDGSIAGPRVLEHMVDTVLYFEGDSSNEYRILRTVKNRFGPSGEIALLSMADSGLHEVTNASEFFLLNRHEPQIGTAVVPIIEGSRVIVVELQSLVNKSHFGLPQRVSSGVNPRKLALLLAVLERHGGIMLGDHDVFFNIAGGLSVAEPAIDLGMASAVLSSFRNKPLRRDLAFIGELGLGGEIRPVVNMANRIRELSRLGFRECVVPKPSKTAEWYTQNYGLTIVPCSRIADLQHVVF